MSRGLQNKSRSYQLYIVYAHSCSIVLLGKHVFFIYAAGGRLAEFGRIQVNRYFIFRDSHFQFLAEISPVGFQSCILY